MSDLRVLARTISAYRVRRNLDTKAFKASKHAIRAQLITLGTLATDNWRFFTRLEDGGGVSAKGAESATQWFCQNWPAELRWPKDVPDLRRYYPPKEPEPEKVELLLDLKPLDDEAA